MVETFGTKTLLRVGGSFTPQWGTERKEMRTSKTGGEYETHYVSVSSSELKGQVIEVGPLTKDQYDSLRIMRVRGIKSFTTLESAPNKAGYTNVLFSEVPPA